MNPVRPSASWLEVVLGTVCAVLALALGAYASDHGTYDHRGALTEEFHQTYALTPDGRIELDNINGDVHVSTWDQNQVKVDAIKYADSKDEVFRQRAVQIKEQRADLAKHHLDVLWSDWYKPEKHDQKFPQLKDALKQAVSQGSKVKASMDKAEAQKWLDLIDQVDKIWEQAGGPQETRVARATASPTRA